MRTLLFSAAVITGVAWANPVPATAEPLAKSGNPSVGATVEKIGWRRQFRRYGYPVPYAYYPPAYGYYAPPPAYADYPPSYGDYSPPAANGDYSSEDDGYAQYPENGDYPPADGQYGDYPPDGS
jgi:hypothetical protein